jgi:uncharacterized membrane protein
MVRKTNEILIAAIILVAFVGAASEAILIVTPSQIEVGDLVSLENSVFESNKTVTDVTTATFYGSVRQPTSMKYVTSDIICNPHRIVFSNPQNVYGAAYYDVNLTVDTEAKTTIEGEKATYILTVKNTGNVTDSFELTYTNPDNANVVDLDRTQVTLAASETETVALTVGTATAGTFGIHVTATSQGDSSKADFVSTTTTVEKVIYGVDLSVDNGAKTTEVGVNATYTLTVKNTGNVTDSFVFTCTNPDNANVVDLDRTQVTLAASETETVALTVGNVTAGTYRVNVTATSQKGTNKTAVVSTTTTVISYGVNLTVDKKENTTVAGENATYTLTVENTGSVVDNFTLKVENANGATVANLSKEEIVNLSAGSSEDVLLNVSDATVGTYRVNVTATSQTDTNKTAVVSTTTTVISYGVNLTVDKKENTTVAGENATYTLTVENTGSVADTYNLTVTNQDNASWLDLNPKQIQLNESETENVTLKVGNAAVGTFLVNVTATSQSDTNKTAAVYTTTTVISYGVNLTVDKKEKTVVVGENALYTLTVKNTGSVWDKINLTVTNLDNASVMGLNMTQVQLNTSETETVALKVGNTAVGTYRVNVTATSQNDSTKTACVNITTTVASVTVTPPSVNVGDFVTIEGAGFDANETLTLSCHVSDLEVPVSGNNYKYSLKEFNLSDPNTGFSLSVQEVEDDTEVRIKKQGLSAVINKDSPLKYGFKFDYNGTTHTSTVSVPMPIDPHYTGIYELIEVSGTVIGDTTEVFMDLTVDKRVTTDATGYFKTVIDTHGFPLQEYTITADGVAATLTVCHLIVPDHAVMTGELVTIEGEGFGAKEQVTLSCHVSDFEVPVSDDKYEYTLKEFNLSDPNTGFSLSVREVKDDMEIRLKKQGGTLVWIKDDKYGFKFDYDSTTDTATVSVPMPIDPSYTGIYEFIEVSGTAFGGTSNVYMDIRVTNSVTTTESGYFETVIDTHGFPPHEYTITATSATASAKATLTIIPATGAITVTSSPTGAAIELDGNSTKLKTNATISDVSPGTHSIKLTLDGYQGWSENVPVQAGETYYVNATLTPNPTPAPRGGGGGGGGSGGGPADTDGDGYCNIDETIMGTDPEDPCDPDPNCVACQALVGTHILPPVVEQTPRPTSTIKYLTTPTPRPKPTPAATPTPTPKPLLPILGPDKPIILIVIIVAVSVLIAALFFLHRKFKSVDTENHDSDRIIWR